MRRVAENMLEEAGYGRSGASFTTEWVAELPSTATSPLFGDAAEAVRATGTALADVHLALDRYWTNSSNEIIQTLESYLATDDEAAAAADEMYREHEKNPVPEENRT